LTDTFRGVRHRSGSASTSACIVTPNPGPLVRGTIAAFHADPDDPVTVAAALAGRMPGTSAGELEALAALGSPGPLFSVPSFVVRSSYVAISPCDDRCYAGEVVIRPDAQGEVAQLSGELFTLRQIAT
jgi:hypothetical protein